jgi:bifunctional DNase/RNase
VEHVFIHSLDDSVFHASIQLRDADSATHQIDSRPSDAIALALRVDSKVLVDAAVLEQAVMSEASVEETIKSILERMRPEDMGEYEM